MRAVVGSLPGSDEGGDANESDSENAGEESQPDEDKGVSSDEHWKEIGRTEVVNDNLSPIWHREDFTVPLPVDSTDSVLRVEVFDWDRRGGNEFLGEILLDGETISQLPPEMTAVTMKLRKKAGQTKA